MKTCYNYTSKYIFTGYTLSLIEMITRIKILTQKVIYN